MTARLARLVSPMPWISAAFVVAALLACGGGDDDAGASTPTSATPVAPTVQSTTVPAATEPVVAATSAPPATALCDDEVDAMLAVVDGSIDGSRLAPGGSWSFDTDGAAFADRTLPTAEFAYRLGLDCTVRAVQLTADGSERFVVGAWTGERRAWVVQATDGPSTPYSPDIRFQLFIDQPDGEWIEDQAVWAGTLDTGETMIVGTADTSTGLTAKSWWEEVPRFEDLEVAIDAERYAIDALAQAGARNVSVAEPADFGVELAAVQFITPEGLILIGTIGPPDWFDPAAQLFDGEMSVEQIGGVDVYVTTGAADAYAVGSVGWMCGDYVWYIDAVYGTVEELTDWATTVIESTGC